MLSVRSESVATKMRRRFKMRGELLFSDPRKGADRRSSISRHLKRREERRTRRIDRRSYLQHGADKPWWLMRRYVTAEKFIVIP